MESVILGLVGVVLSLIFKYAPKVKEWFDAQGNKGLVMLGLTALVSLGYFGLACTSFGAQFGITASCSESTAVELVKAFFTIAIGNQLTYLYTK